MVKIIALSIFLGQKCCLAALRFIMVLMFFTFLGWVNGELFLGQCLPPIFSLLFGVFAVFPSLMALSMLGTVFYEQFSNKIENNFDF